MQENFDYSVDKLPDDVGYNCIYKHKWNIQHHGLALSTVTDIQGLIKNRWGWHFEPHKDMDYQSDHWFEKQDCILSFESRYDLILCKLCITINKY